LENELFNAVVDPYISIYRGMIV